MAADIRDSTATPNSSADENRMLVGDVGGIGGATRMRDKVDPRGPAAAWWARRAGFRVHPSDRPPSATSEFARDLTGASDRPVVAH
ncbi:hypothetical protein Aau02nite_14390 [Amorphoplanes auranticolor]|uniref:Uncharacterized protein n=1 Tax=Actinoplanes auranticolor TaxID=47988 RepID=A0A919S5I4_9ACTN|nr:hypothetical protein Aau02nite_14390 [Actinoplanes auranticolor]